MTFYAHKAAGRYLAESCGRDYQGQLLDYINSMSCEERQVFLLSAIVELSKGVRQDIRSISQKLKKGISEEGQVGANAVADGRLSWARGEMDMEIDAQQVRKLPVRARKAIARGGFTKLSELTPESLIKLKNCGQVTVAIILQWKDRQRNGER